MEGFPDVPELGWEEPRREEKPQRIKKKQITARCRASLGGAAGGRAGPGAAPRWLLAFPKSLPELTSAGGSCFPSGKPRHDPCVRLRIGQGAATGCGDGDRALKSPPSSGRGPQGTAPARCFHLAAGDGYRARRALPFRPLKQTAGYPDRERGEQG